MVKCRRFGGRNDLSNITRDYTDPRAGCSTRDIQPANVGLWRFIEGRLGGFSGKYFKKLSEILEIHKSLVEIQPPSY